MCLFCDIQNESLNSNNICNLVICKNIILSNIYYLDLSNLTNLIKIPKELFNLKHLSIENSLNITKLPYFKNLKTLNIKNTNINNIEKYINLKELNVSNCKKINNISNLNKLEILLINDNTNITEINNLKYLNYLECMDNINIVNILNCNKLKILLCDNSKNLKIIDFCKNIETLSCTNCIKLIKLPKIFNNSIIETEDFKKENNKDIVIKNNGFLKLNNIEIIKFQNKNNNIKIWCKGCFYIKEYYENIENYVKLIKYILYIQYQIKKKIFLKKLNNILILINKIYYAPYYKGYFLIEQKFKQNLKNFSNKRKFKNI